MHRKTKYDTTRKPFEQRKETEAEKAVLKEKIARLKKKLGVVGTTLHREFETTKSKSKENVKNTTKL